MQIRAAFWGDRFRRMRVRASLNDSPKPCWRVVSPDKSILVRLSLRQEGHSSLLLRRDPKPPSDRVIVSRAGTLQEDHASAWSQKAEPATIGYAVNLHLRTIKEQRHGRQ